MLKKLNTWAKRKARAWLDVDREHANAINYIQTVERRLAAAMDSAADVSFKGNTQIIMISRLQGGQVRFFDLQIDNLRDFNERAAAILGPAWPDAVIDAPMDFKRIMTREARMTI